MVLEIARIVMLLCHFMLFSTKKTPLQLRSTLYILLGEKNDLCLFPVLFFF